MYDVYIIQSEKDGSYYTGHTNNLDKRIEEHNREKNKYTKSKKPWILVYREKFATRAQAMKREAEIKKKKRSSYIEWLIQQVG